MIQWLMALALRERVVVISAAILLLLAGLVFVYPARHRGLSRSCSADDRSPDPADRTTAPRKSRGWSRFPPNTAMSGMLHLKSMESISLYGLVRHPPVFRLGKRLRIRPHPDHKSVDTSSRCRRASSRVFRRRIRSARSIGLPPNSRQIISRVFGCFPPPGAESVSPLLAVRTRLGVSAPRLECGRRWL